MQQRTNRSLKWSKGINIYPTLLWTSSHKQHFHYSQSTTKCRIAATSYFTQRSYQRKLWQIWHLQLRLSAAFPKGENVSVNTISRGVKTQFSFSPFVITILLVRLCAFHVVFFASVTVFFLSNHDEFLFCGILSWCRFDILRFPTMWRECCIFSRLSGLSGCFSKYCNNIWAFLECSAHSVKINSPILRQTKTVAVFIAQLALRRVWLILIDFLLVIICTFVE